MTKDEIKLAEKTPLINETNDKLEYDGVIGGVKALIIYKFKGNRLVQAGYLFPGMIWIHPDFSIDPSGMSSRPNPYEDHYKVRSYFVTKYGKPTTERQWKEARGKSIIKNSGVYWSMDRTLISHVLSVADNGMFVAHLSGYYPIATKPGASLNDHRRPQK